MWHEFADGYGEKNAQKLVEEEFSTGGSRA